MTTRTITSGLAAMGLVLTAGACNELERIDDGGSSARGIPDEVQRAFDGGCNITGCHDGGVGGGGLDLRASAAPSIIGGSSTQSSLPLVELGNVQGSYLAIKLLPDGPLQEGDRMPTGRDFSDPQVATDSAIILGWIAGAELPGGGGGGMDTGDMTTTGPAEVVMCGLAEVAPNAANPFDIGTAADQIPPDIGAALTNSCGCHEVDPTEVVAGAPPYSGQVHFSTIAETQADYMGRPVYEVMLERVQSTEFSRMPPNYYCVLEDGEPITAADQQLLIDWLQAGAPDAPNWNPG